MLAVAPLTVPSINPAMRNTANTANSPPTARPFHINGLRGVLAVWRCWRWIFPYTCARVCGARRPWAGPVRRRDGPAGLCGCGRACSGRERSRYNVTVGTRDCAGVGWGRGGRERGRYGVTVGTRDCGVWDGGAAAASGPLRRHGGHAGLRVWDERAAAASGAASIVVGSPGRVILARVEHIDLTNPAPAVFRPGVSPLGA